MLQISRFRPDNYSIVRYNAAAETQQPPAITMIIATTIVPQQVNWHLCGGIYLMLTGPVTATKVTILSFLTLSG